MAESDPVGDDDEGTATGGWAARPSTVRIRVARGGSYHNGGTKEGRSWRKIRKVFLEEETFSPNGEKEAGVYQGAMGSRR